MPRLLVVILLSILLPSCGDKADDFGRFDSSKMDALFINDPQYREKIISELEESQISYEKKNILDGDLYIITWKEDKARVDEIYREVIGSKPGENSVYVLSEAKFQTVVDKMEINDVSYTTGKYYGASYIEWSENDDTKAKRIINQVFESNNLK